MLVYSLALRVIFMMHSTFLMEKWDKHHHSLASHLGAISCVIEILDWGPVLHFCALEALQPVWLMAEVYCTLPRTISKRSYSGRQVPLASTTCGSPLAARGGIMGGNSGQMMRGICTQGSFTCRKSAT
jgi:hypothetical protein